MSSKYSGNHILHSFFLVGVTSALSLEESIRLSWKRPVMFEMFDSLISQS